MKQLEGLWADEQAATAVEYALIVAAIAAVIIATVVSLGSKVQGSYGDMNDRMPAP